MITRRMMISGLITTATGAFLPSPLSAGDNENPARPGTRLDSFVTAIDPELDLFNVHTEEQIRVRFHGITGYDHHALISLHAIMRDWRQSEVRNVDLRVYWGLAALRQAAMKEGHSGKITLLSGYRSRKTNEYLRRIGVKAARDSYHLRARAADFRFDNVNTLAIARYAEWLEIGGVGHYAGNFVHIDSGENRRWTG